LLLLVLEWMQAQLASAQVLAQEPPAQSLLFHHPVAFQRECLQ
jgi:hypothetical protein